MSLDRSPLNRRLRTFSTVVGVQPVLGRVFRTEESQEQFQTVVISNAFWRKRFNSDPDVLGKTFRIDGVVSAVVGVMPAGFTGFAPWYSSSNEPTEVWKPINQKVQRMQNAATTGSCRSRA